MNEFGCIHAVMITLVVKWLVGCFWTELPDVEIFESKFNVNK